MGENTLTKQNVEALYQFLAASNLPHGDWELTQGRRAIQSNNANLLYNDITQQLTFQGKTKHRIPTLEQYLLFKREKECRTRGFNTEEIEREEQHITGSTRELWFVECDGWETSDAEGKNHQQLKRPRDRASE